MLNNMCLKTASDVIPVVYHECPSSNYRFTPSFICLEPSISCPELSFSCLVQRRLPIIVLRINIHSAVKQQPHYCLVLLFSCPMQRRLPVTLLCINIHSMFKLHYCLMPLYSCPVYHRPPFTLLCIDIHPASRTIASLAGIASSTHYCPKPVMDAKDFASII